MAANRYDRATTLPSPLTPKGAKRAARGSASSLRTLNLSLAWQENDKTPRSLGPEGLACGSARRFWTSVSGDEGHQVLTVLSALSGSQLGLELAQVRELVAGADDEPVRTRATREAVLRVV